MKQILLIAKKEIFNYITSPVGYVFAALLTTVSIWIFFGNFFVDDLSDLSPLFSLIIFLFSIFIPAISMGLVAEEKKNGNWELILSLPVDETQMVLGKFFGSMLFLCLTLILFLPIVITIFLIGKPETGVVLSGILSVVLIGATYLSTGILASCLTNSSVIAFLVTTVFLTINNFMGQAVILDRMPNMIKQVFTYLSLSARTSSMSYGQIDLGDVVFFISWIAISIVLSVMALKSRDK